VERLPGLIFHVHGGGFVAQSSFSHEIYLRHWAKQNPEAVFLCVDYTLAGANAECKYPMALDECIEVYKWALENAHRIGWRGERLAMVGDSAGGNLVTALTARLIMEALRVPDGLVLCYPVLSLTVAPSPSRLFTLWDPMLPRELLGLCAGAYLPDDVDPLSDPYLSPVVCPAETLARSLLPPISESSAIIPTLM